MEISYRIQEGATGIGKALYLAKDIVHPDNDIVCILGDNIFDNSELKTDYVWGAGKSAQVFIKEVPNPQDYGVADIKNGAIVRIVEKPTEFVSSYGVIGLYIYRGSAVFDVIESVKPSNRGELEISDVNQFFVENNMMQYEIVKGYWGDSGSSIQKYTECNIYGTKLAHVSSEEIESFRSKVFDDK
jgi:glucose-1-phosphate thymidylyltransferase